LATLLLALITLAAFWPVVWNEFTEYDDPDYVTSNPHVQAGLSWQGLDWAFGRLHGERTYWHPLTWVSHMLDCQLFGLKPAGHHLVNLLFHTFNAVLVFLVFRRMTGAFWRCAVLACLFALHPLQVDTVAWVAERKNLLSGLFWLLTMWAYTRYAEGRGRNAEGTMQNAQSSIPYSASDNTQHASSFYLLSLLFFALGLMCKPVLVTLPFVLLLLDYWPLQRSQPSSLNPQPWTAFRLAAEKAPFFLLAGVSSVITIVSHRALMALGDAAAGLPLEARVENAVVSYVRYLGKTVWPSRLAVFYPHPVSWETWVVVLSGALLLTLSALSIAKARSRPYLLVGWFWFLGVLVPFIGVIQAGSQAMADRFVYVPIIGLLLAIVWGAHDAAARWRQRDFTLSACATAAALLCLALTHRQIGYWKNHGTLFRHALAVTENNADAHYNLATRLAKRGAFDEAIRHYEEAVRISPEDVDSHTGLGYALVGTGRFVEAIEQYRESLRLNPGDTTAHNNLGDLLARQGRVDEAIEHLTESLRLDSKNPEAHANLGLALARRGSYPEAIAHYRAALEVWTNHANVRNDLGEALARSGQVDEAIEQFTEALRLEDNCSETHYLLGLALAQKKDWKRAGQHLLSALRLNPNSAVACHQLGLLSMIEHKPSLAVEYWRQAARLDPNWPEPLNNLAWILATDPRPELRDGPAALKLAARAAELSGTNNAQVLDTLAAAYAETGRFAEATNAIQEAIALSAAAKATNSIAEFRLRLNLYQKRRPYRAE